jgi:hypothetical protein
MATKVLDLFTGADDVDITGRVPDGGGLGLATGEWLQVADSPGTGTIDLVALTPGDFTTETENNQASIIATLPTTRAVGDFLGIAVYTRDNTARSPSTPTDWAEAHVVTGAGRLVLYYRICDGTEPDTVTVSFTGLGAVGVDECLVAFNVPDVDTADPLGALGAASTWLSANNLGPITGLTPEAADSIILLFAAKQNDFNTTNPTATDWWRGAMAESTAGSDAGLIVMFQQQVGGPTAIGNATIADTGQAGAGVGFMLELKRGAVTPGVAVHRTPSGLQDWNHYVVKDIPDLGGLGVTDMMVEGVFQFREGSAGVTWAGVIARAQEVVETNYEANLVTFASGNHTLDLEYSWEGTHTLLRSVSMTGIDLTAPVTIRLCVTGMPSAVQIEVWVNEVRIIPDDGTLDPLGTFTHIPASGFEIVGGWPGACMNDGTRSGLGIQMSSWRAAEFCSDTIIPCEGGPDNPYPWDPPPTGNGVTTLDVMDNLVWREATIPETGTDGVRVADQLVGKAITGVWVMDNLQWRSLADEVEGPPPPDSTFPPHYDPCELLPDLPDPPTTVLDPPPDRLFFAYDLAVTQLGTLFTAAVRATGGHTPGEITQATARSGYVIGSQGGYGKFLDPTYDPDLMDAWIDSHAAYMDAVVASPTFYGQQVADDFASTHRWPPSGLSVAELSRIIAYWKAAYPGIRCGIRARPSQWPGSYPTGIDFVICQYRYWGLGGQTPTQFRDTELALAVTRGWDVLWSMNFLDGGPGGVGDRLTAAELLAAGMVFASDGTNNHGVGGWKAESAWLASPGILDALATIRNQLALLGPP